MTSYTAKASLPKRIRRRFLILIPIVLVCFIVANAHISEVGGTYEYILTYFPGETFTEENVTVYPPEMVTVASVTQDDQGYTHVVFEAGEPGEGQCVVGSAGGGMAFALKTTENGIVVADYLEVNGWEYAFVAIVVTIAGVGIVCACNFATLLRNAWFGYEMAAYAGGALFFIVQGGIMIVFALLGTINSFGTMAGVVIGLATFFVNGAMLPMAIIALFIAASNAVLLRREGVGFTNMLGVVWAVLWALLFVGLWVYRSYFSNIIPNVYAATFIDSALSATVAYAIALFLGTCVTALLAARHKPAFPRDYLIILGCAIRPDGTPTPLLAGRVDAARAYAKSQKEAGFAAPTFVPSGGQGPDEVCSEAESMGRYLAENETDPRILLESRSTTTNENMAFSKQVIAADGAAGDAPVAFATTNYHILRGYVFAREAGLNAEGIASPTKLYFWPNAFLREFIGLLVSQTLAVGITWLVIVVLYFLAEYLLLFT